MSNYTQGTVLGAATMLPATTAAGLMMLNRANTLVITALLAVTLLNLLLSGAMIARYFQNRKEQLQK